MSRLPLAGTLLLTLPLVMLFALSQGALRVPIADLWAALTGSAQALAQAQLVIDLRLPRVLLAALVGAALALAGAAMQGVFRNPLADPGLVGVSSGAMIGAVTAIFLGNPLGLGPWAVPAAAFAGALGVTALTMSVARGSDSMLLLAGIAINALAGVVLGLLTFLSDDRQLRDITFWSMGSVARGGWTGITALVLAGGVGTALILLRARALDALALGDRGAIHVGIDPVATRRWIIVGTALTVGAATAYCGLIGFVGMVVPHLIRLVAGAGHRALLPLSALAGALLLVLADLVARLIAAPVELPVGLMTSAIGAPFFLGLLWLRSHGR